MICRWSGVTWASSQRMVCPISAVSISSSDEGAASVIAVAASRVVVERCARLVDDDVVGDGASSRYRGSAASALAKT
jgi:hypothetical protein